MPTESMKIVIGADLGGAISGIGKLTDAMAGIGSEANQAAGSLNKIPSALRPIDPKRMLELRDAVQRFKQDVASFPKTPIPDPFRNIPKGANAAGFALSNVGRVAQDLPFGFIGIQNNLNPLLESFQRLKAETGSSKAALQALGSSLIGAGGIGLALSVVSSAILIFQNGISGFNSKSKEATDAANKLKDSIKSIADIQNEATGSAQGQIAALNALLNIVTDTAKSEEIRKKGLKEIEEIDKRLTKGINLQASSLQVLRKRVEEYTEALINQAIVEKFKDSIADVAIAIGAAEAEEKKANATRQRANTELEKAQANYKKVADALKDSNGLLREGSQANLELEKASVAVAKAQSQFNLADAAARTKSETVTKLLEDRILKTNELNEAQLRALKLPKIRGGDEEVDTLKRRIEALKELQGLTGLTGDQQVELVRLEMQLITRDGKKLGFTSNDIQDYKDAILEKAFPKDTFEFGGALHLLKVKVGLEPIIIDKQKPLTDAVKFDIAKDLNLDKIPVNFADPIIKQMEAIGQKMEEVALTDQALETANVLSNVLGPAFDQVFTAITSGQNAFNAVGDALKRLVADMIQAVVRAAALAAIFSLIFPGGSGGLNFLGAFKKFLGGGFADGGVASGPKSGYLALLHGTELIIPMDKIGQANPGQLRGSSIDAMQRIIVEGKISGEDIHLSNRRVNRRHGRMF